MRLSTATSGRPPPWRARLLAVAGARHRHRARRGGGAPAAPDRGRGARARGADHRRAALRGGGHGVRRRSLVSNLYRAARMANDVTTLASGNPHRIARRAKNKIVGRAAARAGIWRVLWR